MLVVNRVRPAPAAAARELQTINIIGRRKAAIAQFATVLDPRFVARELGGDVSGGCNVLAPGPGHSRADRSLSVKVEPTAPDGFLVYSFAGDDPIVCREHVRTTLGLGPGEHLGPSPRPGSNPHPAFALHVWKEARDPRGTMAEQYLASRKLSLAPDIAGEVIRFHPALRFNGELLGGIVSLFRDIRTNEPCGIHRIFLDCTGRKLARKMLGRVRSAAIKLDGDEIVELGLHIGEGVETCLAARLAGFRPVWVLGSAGAIATFPVLSGIEAITVLGEVNDGGANQRAAQLCAARWIEAGKEAYIVTPLIGSDLNDVWCEAVS
jgi:hypothetical protein